MSQYGSKLSDAARIGIHLDVVPFGLGYYFLFQFKWRCQDIILAEWCSAVANTRDVGRRGNLSEVEIGTPNLPVLFAFRMWPFVSNPFSVSVARFARRR